MFVSAAASCLSLRASIPTKNLQELLTTTFFIVCRSWTGGKWLSRRPPNTHKHTHTRTHRFSSSLFFNKNNQIFTSVKLTKTLQHSYLPVPPACQSVSLSLSLSVFLSVCLSVCLSACLSLCLLACQSVSLSLFLSVSLFLSACLSLSLSLGLSVLRRLLEVFLFPSVSVITAASGGC